jgi:hypothetical protein
MESRPLKQTNFLILLSLSAFSLIFTACVSENSTPPVAAPLDGTYYIPGKESEDISRSESLVRIKNDRLTSYEVHNGAMIETEVELKRVENRLFIAETGSIEASYDCNGQIVLKYADGGYLNFFGVEYWKVGDDLLLVVGGEPLLAFSAKQEDIDRITSLPACKKQ